MRKGQTGVDMFTHSGKSLTAAGWAKELGIPKHVFYLRLSRLKNKELIYHKGCLRNRTMKRTLHGWAKTPTYESWNSMVQRCTNPEKRGWKNYGGRGVTVCKRWRVFRNFLADMGVRPKGLSLDRTNNNGNYCKVNCRWATPAVQSNNTRRNVYLKIGGSVMTVSDAAVHLGISKDALYSRLSRQRLQKRNYGLHVIC